MNLVPGVVRSGVLRPARSRCHAPAWPTARWCWECAPSGSVPGGRRRPPPALEMLVEVVEPLGQRGDRARIGRRGRLRRAGRGHRGPLGRSRRSSSRERGRGWARRCGWRSIPPSPTCSTPAPAPRSDGRDARPRRQPLGVDRARSRPPRARPRSRRLPRVPARARRPMPAPVARATTRPARNESPLPTGYAPGASSVPVKADPSARASTAPAGPRVTAPAPPPRRLRGRQRAPRRRCRCRPRSPAPPRRRSP